MLNGFGTETKEKNTMVVASNQEDAPSNSDQNKSNEQLLAVSGDFYPALDADCVKDSCVRAKKNLAALYKVVKCAKETVRDNECLRVETRQCHEREDETRKYAENEKVKRAELEKRLQTLEEENKSFSNTNTHLLSRSSLCTQLEQLNQDKEAKLLELESKYAAAESARKLLELENKHLKSANDKFSKQSEDQKARLAEKAPALAQLKRHVQTSHDLVKCLLSAACSGQPISRSDVVFQNYCKSESQMALKLLGQETADLYPQEYDAMFQAREEFLQKMCRPRSVSLEPSATLIEDSSEQVASSTKPTKAKTKKEKKSKAKQQKDDGKSGEKTQKSKSEQSASTSAKETAETSLKAVELPRKTAEKQPAAGKPAIKSPPLSRRQQIINQQLNAVAGNKGGVQIVQVPLKKEKKTKKKGQIDESKSQDADKDAVGLIDPSPIDDSIEIVDPYFDKVIAKALEFAQELREKTKEMLTSFPREPPTSRKRIRPQQHQQDEDAIARKCSKRTRPVAPPRPAAPSGSPRVADTSPRVADGSSRLAAPSASTSSAALAIDDETPATPSGSRSRVAHVPKQSPKKEPQESSGGPNEAPKQPNEGSKQPKDGPKPPNEGSKPGNKGSLPPNKGPKALEELPKPKATTGLLLGPKPDSQKGPTEGPKATDSDDDDLIIPGVDKPDGAGEDLLNTSMDSENRLLIDDDEENSLMIVEDADPDKEGEITSDAKATDQPSDNREAYEETVPHTTDKVAKVAQLAPPSNSSAEIDANLSQQDSSKRKAAEITAATEAPQSENSAEVPQSDSSTRNPAEIAAEAPQSDTSAEVAQPETFVQKSADIGAALPQPEAEASAKDPQSESSTRNSAEIAAEAPQSETSTAVTQSESSTRNSAEIAAERPQPETSVQTYADMGAAALPQPEKSIEKIPVKTSESRESVESAQTQLTYLSAESTRPQIALSVDNPRLVLSPISHSVDACRLTNDKEGEKTQNPNVKSRTDYLNPDYQKRWKKMADTICKWLSDHRHAKLFLRPIKDSQADGYSTAVRRPQDLSTLKKQIKDGTICTNSELEREVRRIFANAYMFNQSMGSIASDIVPSFQTEAVAHLRQQIELFEEVWAQKIKDEEESDDQET